MTWLMANVVPVLVKSLLAVLVGGLIGSERARHGRAAGMRTHILVCLGSAMTAMTGVYIMNVLGGSSDITRIPAQVMSGIGFLGAGMIILKNDREITGLTTAAGVWVTASIGIALGYGFYWGVATVTVLYLVAIIFVAKLEKNKRHTDRLYVEIDDAYALNETADRILKLLQSDAGEYYVVPANSGIANHVGLRFVLDSGRNGDIAAICALEHVVFAVEEK